MVVSKVAEQKGSNGFDALALEYCDLIERGVITPAKVDRTALQNALSVAALLLTCDCTVCEAPSDDDGDDHGGGGGGMGGMGGGMPGMGGMGGMGGGMPGMGGMGGMGGMM